MSDKTKFTMYVDVIIRQIKKDEGEKYKNIRTSNRLREYGSLLITQLLEHFAKLIETIKTNTIERGTGKLVSKSRTINTGLLISLVRTILVNDGVDAETVAAFVRTILDKCQLLKAKGSRDRAAKESKLSEFKKAEDEAARASKKFESAKTRAAKNAAKNAELQASLAQLEAEAVKAEEKKKLEAERRAANGEAADVKASS